MEYVYQCKNCRGKLKLLENSTTVECKYCFTVQTVPIANSVGKLESFSNAYDRLMEGRFNSALNTFKKYNEAEAYWGRMLCDFGVNYEKDPVTGKSIPTIHKLSFKHIDENENYRKALQLADIDAREIYKEEARKLEQIRLRSIDVANNGVRYDVFICYKERDAYGGRTEDSRQAQIIYDALSEKGLKVFFSQKTLANKPGIEFEPYIFAALNSAKVMIIVGTSSENFNATWVRNEWSRFLDIKESGKLVYLFPCYKRLNDPQRELPYELRGLQAIDLDRSGALQDLIRAVENVTVRKKTDTVRKGNRIILPIVLTAIGVVSVCLAIMAMKSGVNASSSCKSNSSAEKNAQGLQHIYDSTNAESSQYDTAIVDYSKSSKESTDDEYIFEPTPTLLTSLKYTQKSQFIKAGNDYIYDALITDVNGNKHEKDSILFLYTTDWYNQPEEGEAYIVYNLNFEFSTLTGTVYRPYESLSCDHDWKQATSVKIYGDGNLLYEAPNITTNTYNSYTFSLDVSNVRNLRIEMFGMWSTSTLMGFDTKEFFSKICIGDLWLS